MPDMFLGNYTVATPTHYWRTVIVFALIFELSAIGCYFLQPYASVLVIIAYITGVSAGILLVFFVVAGILAKISRAALKHEQIVSTNLLGKNLKDFFKNISVLIFVNPLGICRKYKRRQCRCLIFSF
jgi:hypothetical protein